MTLVAAHRGLSAAHPENTLLALRAAAEAGFDGIEVDVRATHDGEVVLLHDAAVDRTTDCSGRVADMDYDELRGCTTGDGPVPRLDDAFSALASWRGSWLLELKTRHVARSALDLVEHHGLQGRCIMASMDPRAVAVCLEAQAETPRALIVLGPPDAEDLATARRLGCQWVNLDHAHARDAAVRRCVEDGFHVGAWTVNDPEAAVRLAGSGVACVITDTDHVLRAVRAAG